MTKFAKPDPEGKDSVIEPDDQTEFSDIGSSLDTDFTSLSSSLLDHVYENGRRYHSLNAGRYVLPNDETEQERLDMTAHARRLLLGGELQVPKLPKKLNRVLDCGTGTGVWAINFADEHPETHVIGVDLSPIQPVWVPPNCVFEVDDLEKEWLWKEPFDFIHSCDLSMGIKDWKRYMKNVYDHLSPGGLAEFVEPQCRPGFHSDDGTIPKGGYVEKYVEIFERALRDANILEISILLESYLKETGFVDVQSTIRKLPLGPWPKDRYKKDVGRWGLEIARLGFRSYGAALFARQLNIDLEEALQLCDNAFKEMCRRDVHMYAVQWYVWGRKPDHENKGKQKT